MNFETDYRQFVDSVEPLSSIQEKDWTFYEQCGLEYPFLYATPDPNRQDYFARPYSEDPLQRLDIHHLKTPEKKKRPVIFYIHGGGWTNEDKSNTRFVAHDWIKNGYTVVSINYRLSPNVTHPSIIEDCAKALKWVQENIHDYGGDPNRICVVGHSAGGHLAALLVTGAKWHKKYDIDINKVKCWIPISGIHDFNLPENSMPPMLNAAIIAMLGGDDNKVECSPVSHITGKEPPCLILHGGDDWLIPKTNSIELHEKLVEKKAKDVRLCIVKGYAHCNMILGFEKPGHIPAELINEYLDEMLTTSEGKKA